MMSGLIACVLATSALPVALPEIQSTSPDIVITRVFGPETPGGLYKHPAAITELDNGDLYLAFYGGTGEYGDDTKVFGARLAKGAEQFTEPVVIADTPFRSEGNPVLWQGPDGLVWLFYVIRLGDTWSTSLINLKISRDSAKTWSDSYLLTLEQGTMVRSQPIMLNNGDYLLPIYHETGFDRELVGDDTTSLFMRRDAKTGQWSESGRIRSRMGNLQPSVVQIDDDYLIAYCRRGGGYDPIEDGYMVRAESRDGGHTWSEGVDSAFPNPNSAIDFIKLQSGNLLLVYNDSMVTRTPLSVALSMDNDKTWPIKHHIVEGPGPYAYPYVIQGKDGRIHLIFTSHGRTVINHAVFEEEALIHWKAR